MLVRVVAVLLVSVSYLFAQNATISIHDSNGNQAIGTVIDGSVFFHDTNGNISVGTIKDGNVFLNTNSGETVFGTVKNGNVFLTDKTGITTGTIQNGNIFLHRSDGSLTTGTYDSSGNLFTSTTNATGSGSNTTQSQQAAAQNQAAYDAGYAMGSAMGNGIIIAVERHRLKAFCKNNPSGVYVNERTGYYSGTLCPEAPLSAAAHASVDKICNDNPGAQVNVGLHVVRCFTPPAEPNLKWAKWEMDALRTDYETQATHHTSSTEQARSDWTAWNSTYCRLAGSKGSYKDLDGSKKHCQ